MRCSGGAGGLTTCSSLRRRAAALQSRSAPRSVGRPRAQLAWRPAQLAPGRSGGPSLLGPARTFCRFAFSFAPILLALAERLPPARPGGLWTSPRRCARRRPGAGAAAQARTLFCRFPAVQRRAARSGVDLPVQARGELAVAAARRQAGRRSPPRRSAEREPHGRIHDIVARRSDGDRQPFAGAAVNLGRGRQ